MASQPENDGHEATTSLATDLSKLGFKDFGTLFALFKSEIKGSKQDDNKFVQEHLIQILSKLDENSKIGNQLTNSFIGTLWSATTHPSQSSLGSKYQYREADGLHNNIRLPHIGQANTSYARTVKPSVLQNVALPDLGLIFDTLLARGDTFQPHPCRISTVLFNFATIITHDIFRTDHADFNNSLTSSYLDLSPLYGCNQEEQDSMRTFKDGRIKPDCFSSLRLGGRPPGVGVLLVMFNRFHNHVVDQLALINEDGRFTKPSGKAADSKKAKAKYDNDLFQTGRLITCGLYINCILKDYVRAILALNRTGTKWDLDPRTEEGKSLFQNPAEEGTGNQCSAEFNLLYRWHSTVSEKDELWTQDLYTEMFPGKNPADIPMEELLARLSANEKMVPKDPSLRDFAKLKRQADGTYNDDALVEILEASIADVAGSFGANRVPKILRAVEILGIIQSRSWNIATLNEFREFSGLKRHDTFEDINPDKEVAENLRKLYGHPDLVELSPGLIVEKAKPPMTPGSGLCAGFTTSYAILADAVSLVRGDRFFTLDYHPKALTNWGFNEVQYDTSVDDGAVFYKLILRAFPNHFKGNSIYAHFPLTVPDENLVIFKSLDLADKYSWDRPTRAPLVPIITSYAAAKKILEDKVNWKITLADSISFLTSQPKKENGLNYCAAGDDPVNAESRKLVMSAIYPQDWYQKIQRFYEDNLDQLLDKHSFKLPDTKSRQVDIVRDISNLVHTRFAASVFSLPLKTEDSSQGVYTEQELYQVLTVCFMSVFMDMDVTKSFQLKQTAHDLAQQLGEHILSNVEAMSLSGFASLFHHKKSSLTEYGTHVIKRMLEAKLPVKEVVWSQILPTAVSAATNQSQIFCQALDYYLGAGKQHLKDLYKLAHEHTAEADDKMLRYFMEGARLNAGVAIFRDYKPNDSDLPATISSGSNSTITVPVNSRVLLNLHAASRDPKAFPDPEKVDLTRPMASYLLYGWGPHQCAGTSMSKAAQTAMFKKVFKLKGLRRATSAWGENPGELKKIPIPGLDGMVVYLTQNQGSYFPVPTTMTVVWDEE